LRIGYITSTFPKDIGDSWGIFILDLAQSLALKNHDVFVITQRYRKSHSHEKWGNVTISRFNWLSSKIFKRLADYRRIPYLRMISYVLSGLYSTINLVRKHDIQMLIANWAVPSGFLGVIVKRITKRPLLVYVHGSDINMWLKKPEIRSLVIKTLNRVDGIITVNNTLLEKINELGIKNCVKAVAPMGVNIKKLEKIGLKRKNIVPTILFVGAMRPVKGLDFLISSLHLIKEEIPEFKLILAGDGPLRPKLEKRTQNEGLSQYVEFLGQVPHDNAIQLVQTSDIVVLPSLSEGTPTVMFEALACKTPLIASHVGGIPEIITHGKNGLLIAPKSPKAISNAIIYLVKNKEAREKLAENGYKHIKDLYTLEKTAEKILKVCAAILRNL